MHRRQILGVNKVLRGNDLCMDSDSNGSPKFEFEPSPGWPLSMWSWLVWWAGRHRSTKPSKQTGKGYRIIRIWRGHQKVGANEAVPHWRCRKSCVYGSPLVVCRCSYQGQWCVGIKARCFFLLRETVWKLGRFFRRIRRSDVDIFNLPKQNRHPPQLWPAPMDGIELQRFQAGETLRISPVGFPFTHHCKRHIHSYAGNWMPHRCRLQHPNALGPGSSERVQFEVWELSGKVSGDAQNLSKGPEEDLFQIFWID